MGTSILRNLQRLEPVGEAVGEVAEETAEQPEVIQADADSIGTSILRNLQYPETAEASAEVLTEAAPVADISNAANPTEALAYNQSTTLGRLSATMPERGISPLVANFRSGSDLSRLDQPLLDRASESVPLSANPDSLTPTSRIEADLQADDPDLLLNSPLLEGLRRESLTQSVIYVPIAEAVPVNDSETLISGAVNMLGSDVSTAAFVDALSQSRLFSSVLSSPELLANSNAQSLNAQNLNAQNSDASSQLSLSERMLQRSKARQAKITLAAHQASQRHQRLAWR